MRRSLLVVMLLTASCSTKTSGGDADYCCIGEGLEMEIAEIDLREIDAPEEGVSDVVQDEVIDSSPEDGPPEGLSCPGAADGGEIDLTPIPPSRTAMPCGPGCRQVSFAESNVYDWHIDVEDGYLVFSTGLTGPTPDISRIWLVDLETLDHYILREEDWGALRKPTVFYPSMDESKVNFLYSCQEVDGIWDRITYEVFSFDIGSCRQTEVWSRLYENQDPCDLPFGPAQLKYDGHYLAWWDGRVCSAWGGQTFLYDLEAGEERLLSPDGCCASEVMMDGNWVVWEQGVPGYSIQIWIHDIARNESRPLTSGSLDKFGPYVHGNRVGWGECVVEGCTKYDGLSADIMMMDVVTEAVTRITNDVHSQSGIVIGDNIVAWADCRNDPENTAECWDRQWDVYMKDLETGEERRLTDLPGGQSPKAIWGNKVYFLTLDLEYILSVFEITL